MMFLENIFLLSINLVLKRVSWLINCNRLCFCCMSSIIFIMPLPYLSSGESTYTVLIKFLKKDNLKQLVHKVPRKAIRFTDKLYSTDQHLENAFRHPISFPDHIFPKQWMDKD